MTGIDLEDGVEDGRSRDRRVAQLGEVAGLDLVAEGDDPVERRQVPGNRPQERRLAGAVGADDADPLSALRGEERRPGDDDGLRRVRAVRVERPASGQVAHGEVLEPDEQLAGPDRTAGQGGAVEAQAAGGLPGRFLPVRAQPLEPGLVLVHLHVLALAAVALDELDLALDRVGVRLGLLDRAGVALLALAVIGGVVAPERRQPAIAELPDPSDGRVEERPVVRRHEEGTGPAAEVLLQPLDGADVEVVRRLVEHQQVRIGDDEPGEGGTGLLAARQRRGRAEPLVAREAEARQRLVHAQVEGVPAEDVEAVLEVGVVGAGRVTLVLHPGELDRHRLEMRRAVTNRATEVRRGHERLVEVGLLAQQAEREPAPA